VPPRWEACRALGRSGMSESRSHRLREGGTSNPSQNRPARTRTPGGVGALADLTVGQDDPIRCLSVAIGRSQNMSIRWEHQIIKCLCEHGGGEKCDGSQCLCSGIDQVMS